MLAWCARAKGTSRIRPGESRSRLEREKQTRCSRRILPRFYLPPARRSQRGQKKGKRRRATIKSGGQAKSDVDVDRVKMGGLVSSRPFLAVARIISFLDFEEVIRLSVLPEARFLSRYRLFAFAFRGNGMKISFFGNSRRFACVTVGCRT